MLENFFIHPVQHSLIPSHTLHGTFSVRYQQNVSTDVVSAMIVLENLYILPAQHSLISPHILERFLFAINKI